MNETKTTKATNGKGGTMARFRQTAKYAGKGQKDLTARAASLNTLGEPEFPRNAEHPHLIDRAAVLEAEKRRGLRWNGGLKRHDKVTDTD